MDFGHIAVFILDVICVLNDVSGFQTHRSSWRQPEPLLINVHPEILSFHPQLTPERNLPRTRRLVLWIVDSRQHFRLAFGVI